MLVRLVGDSRRCAHALCEAAAGLAEVDFTLEIPFVRLRAVEGLPTMIAEVHDRHSAVEQLGRAAAAWGRHHPCGPHAAREASQKELLEAVELYIEVAKQLLA